MSVKDGEDLKCDREGYFDLESLKPYSSVWVSTRRDARSKTHQQDDDNDYTKNVMPSRACNNLHSLLETIEGSPSEEEIRRQVQMLSSTKSDHFPLNPYKLFEKADSVSLKKISDKIIESMCKNDSQVLGNETESAHTCTPSKRSAKSKESIKPPEDQGTGEEQQEAEKSEEETSEDIHCVALNKLQKKNDEEPVKEKNIKDPTLLSHMGGGEPQQDKSAKCKLLSDNGKLVTEMNLTALKLKDQAGREFPVTIKYIWETDVDDIMNTSNTVFNSSPAFMKITESVSTLGMKCDNSDFTITPGHSGKMQTWQERSKSQSSCVQARNVKRLEGWNTDDKEPDSNQHIYGSKGDSYNMKKGPFKETHSIRSALIRPKVSMVGPYHDKKLFDNIHDSRHAEHREGSKINASERKALVDRKNRIPVKKKFPAVEELRGPNTLTRPATFNKREPAPRPAPNRPPSAPTRELPSRIPQRIAIQDSGDKLPQGFNKRPFGTKFQAPATASSANKFWK